MIDFVIIFSPPLITIELYFFLYKWGCLSPPKKSFVAGVSLSKVPKSPGTGMDYIQTKYMFFPLSMINIDGITPIIIDTGYIFTLSNARVSQVAMIKMIDDY